MKKIKLVEGASLRLGSSELAQFKDFLNKNPDLPVKIISQSLVFDNYIIGSITVGNTSIVIEPRITSLTTNDYFEMQLYTEGIISDSLSTLLDENGQYGIEENLINIFLNQCLKLTSKGLEGQFTTNVDVTNVIHGRILINQIKPMDLLRNRVPVEYTIHSLETIENKIIKLALEKCRMLTRTKIQQKKLGLVNPLFENINVIPSEYYRLVSELRTVPSTYVNGNYPTVIKLACKIMDNITLNMRKSKVLGSSYLVNSNNLFEAYGRKVLKNSMKMNVEKWKSPKPIAKFSHGSESYTKSYVPDILIDYNSELESTYALLDTKNKDISNLQNAAKLPDLYQVIFYCQQLNTRFGGLVYPIRGDLEPIKISINGYSNLNFYIFTINFSKTLKLRNIDYVSNVCHVFHTK